MSTTRTCVYPDCPKDNVPVNTSGDLCMFCWLAYPGPDGVLAVQCRNQCVGGMVAVGALGCNICGMAATDDVFTRDQVQRMAHRGTHHEWRKHIERCARELMAWTWFVGDVTFNVGVEFAMAVAVGINQYLNKNWLKIAIREALGHLKIDMPTHSPLAMDQLNDIFSHVKKTLLCLKKTQGAQSSNQVVQQMRLQLSKAIKERIGYKQGEDTFDISKLQVAKYGAGPGHAQYIARMDVAALRKLLVDDGVLGEVSKKRARSVQEVELVGPVVNVRRKKAPEK